MRYTSELVNIGAWFSANYHTKYFVLESASGMCRVFVFNNLDYNKAVLELSTFLTKIGKIQEVHFIEPINSFYIGVKPKVRHSSDEQDGIRAFYLKPCSERVVEI